MTISNNKNNREFDSFVEYPAASGVVVRNVYVANEPGDDIPVKLGPPSGLIVGGVITEVSLNSSSWTALPSSALSGRNALSIQNRSGTEIKINYDNSVVGYVGIVIPDGGERFYDISDSIVIYAKSSSGTPTVVIEEIA